MKISLTPVLLLSTKNLQIIHNSKTRMETIKINNIFNKDGRCTDVKTQKVCKNGQEVNIGLLFP